MQVIVEIDSGEKQLKMYVDWKILMKPYMLNEEYIPNNTRSKGLSSFVFFIVLGLVTSFSLITKVEGYSDKSSPENVFNLKVQKIKEDISIVEKDNAILESEIMILNHNISQMFENRQKQEVLKLSRFTGTHKGIGSGVIVRLSDSDKPVTKDNPNIGLVHNTDLVELVNDLWAGGAEAVSINDERVTVRTGIRCAGSTILVNKTRIAPPFVIKATGNPDKLANSIKKGYLGTFELSGIKYNIEKYDRLEIPADDNIILAGDF